MLSRFDRAVGTLCTGGLWISAVIAIVSIVALEVVCRTFLGTSLFVVEEFVGYLLAAFTMFGLAPTLRSGRILRVEVVYARLTPLWQARAQVVFHIVGLVYLVILESQLDTSKNLGEAGLVCSTVGCTGGGSAWGVRLGFSTSKSGWRACRRRVMSASGSRP